MQIKHLLMTRFFPFQDNRFIYNTKSPAFLKIQVEVLKNNLFSSIKRQTKKDMTLVVIVNKDAYAYEESKKIIDSIKTSSPLPTKILPCQDMGENGFVTDKEYRDFLNNEIVGCDYLIETRTDFDDFFYSEAAERVRSVIKQCPDGITLHGFSKGITYVSPDEMYEFDFFQDTQKRMGNWSTFTSMIFSCKDFVGKPFVSIFNYDHGNSKIPFEKYCSTNGIMAHFVRDETENAFIYVRHDATYTGHENNAIRIPQFAKIRRYTENECKNMIRDVFPSRFGFDIKIKT